MVPPLQGPLEQPPLVLLTGREFTSSERRPSIGVFIVVISIMGLGFGV